MSPWFIHRAVNFLQGSSPLRVKAVHIFHSPYMFSKIYAAMKPLLKPKNQARDTAWMRKPEVGGCLTKPNPEPLSADDTTAYEEQIRVEEENSRCIE
ncbi:unnamed protein product [Trichobilharzia regenti]|nr:unnamed protein product [Trichobilharzia regenti]